MKSDRSTAGFVVLEGICCAGKSVLFERAAERCDWHGIPEASQYSAQAPPPPANASQARSNELITFQLDAQRWQEAHDRWQRGDLVLAERGPIGALSISYGYDPAMGTFQHAAQVLKTMVRAGCFDPPRAYLYLSVDEEVAQARATRRPVRVGLHWTTHTALRRQRLLLESYWSLGTGPPVFTVDGNGPVDVVWARFCQALDEALRVSQPGRPDHGRYREMVVRWLDAIVAADLSPPERYAALHGKVPR